jgi:hypothetical protein
MLGELPKSISLKLKGGREVLGDIADGDAVVGVVMGVRTVI